MPDTEFQQLTPAALSARIQELKAQYYDVKAQVASGKQKNTAAVTHLRRRIARALTRQNSHA